MQQKDPACLIKGTKGKHILWHLPLSLLPAVASSSSSKIDKMALEKFRRALGCRDNARGTCFVRLWKAGFTKPCGFHNGSLYYQGIPFAPKQIKTVSSSSWLGEVSSSRTVFFAPMTKVFLPVVNAKHCRGPLRPWEVETSAEAHPGKSAATGLEPGSTGRTSKASPQNEEEDEEFPKVLAFKLTRAAKNL